MIIDDLFVFPMANIFAMIIKRFTRYKSKIGVGDLRWIVNKEVARFECYIFP